MARCMLITRIISFGVQCCSVSDVFLSFFVPMCFFPLGMVAKAILARSYYMQHFTSCSDMVVSNPDDLDGPSFVISIGILEILWWCDSIVFFGAYDDASHYINGLTIARSGDWISGRSQLVVSSKVASLGGEIKSWPPPAAWELKTQLPLRLSDTLAIGLRPSAVSITVVLTALGSGGISSLWRRSVAMLGSSQGSLWLGSQPAGGWLMSSPLLVDANGEWFGWLFLKLSPSRWLV